MSYVILLQWTYSVFLAHINAAMSHRQVTLVLGAPPIDQPALMALDVT